MSALAISALASLAGGLFGWIGDGGHVSAGVLDYPKEDHFWWPGLAWWVVPQFAAGGLALSLLVRFFMWRKLSEAPRAPLGTCPSYAVSCACFVGSLATYLLSSVLTTMGVSEMSISLTLAVCTVMLGVALTVSAGSLEFGMMLGALAGPIGGLGVAWESSLCAIGVFRYINPDDGLFVNHWIAFLWIGAVWSGVWPMWRAEYARQSGRQRGQAGGKTAALKGH